MEQEVPYINLASFREMIVHAFSIEDINDLVFDLGVQPEEIPGLTLDQKSRELIQYFQRRRRLPELLDRCKRVRSNLNWPIVHPDYNVFEFYRDVFERQAFCEPYNPLTPGGPFAEAINIVITAVNSGILKDRQGAVLKTSKGIQHIEDPKYQEEMRKVQQHLQKIKLLVWGQEQPVNESHASALDKHRDQIILILNNIWQSLGVAQMPLPTSVRNRAQDNP